MSSGKAERREVLTPEGLLLPFEVASPFDRAAALFVDLLLVHAALLVAWLLAILVGASGFGGHGRALGLLASFVLRNAYFPWCEIRYGGATPGKRLFHLRAIARGGGPLPAEALLARNMTRDFEVFLPLAVLLTPAEMLPGLPAWAGLLGTGWLLVGGLLPLFNRDHLRLGDLVGGTMVVRVPPVALLDDVAAPAGAAAATGDEFAFTHEQLALYGIEELQVLERLLRRGLDEQGRELLPIVARRIQKKIGWTGEPDDARALEFLTAFYRHQRAGLEREVLFGVRREHKAPGSLPRAAAGREPSPASPAGASTPAEAPPPEADDASGN